MSMRGIDAQIMVQRTTDYTRETADQVRRGDQTQSFLAARQQAESEITERTVVHTDQPGQAALQNERHGSGRERQDGGEGRPAENDGGREQPTEQELLSAPGTHGSVIDILV